MATRLTGPLNQLDVYRIVNDFDRDNFNTAKPLRKAQVDRVIVMIQFERMWHFYLPIELVNEIMRRCLENSPSVGALLMYYKNTPAIVLLHPLPLSNDTHYINTASKSLLVRFKQKPADRELASYQQLMNSVFTHHFKKLTSDQKLDLIRRCNITPWEQKSTSQKLELLGRIQAPTLWGKAKVNLQLLSWKVQFAAAWALENNIILFAVLGSVVALIFTGLSLWIASCFSSVAGTATYKTLQHGYAKAWLYFVISGFAAMGASLAIAALGLTLRIPIFPKSVQEKGAWLQSVSWNCFLIALYSLIMVLPSDRVQNSNNDKINSDALFNAFNELQRLLLQSINTANITVEQNSFANTLLPDLMNKWLQLTLPSDTNTRSSLTLQ